MPYYPPEQALYCKKTNNVRASMLELSIHLVQPSEKVRDHDG